MATPEEVIEWLLETYQGLVDRYRRCMNSRDRDKCVRMVYNQLLLLCRDYKSLLQLAESYSTYGLSIVNNIILLAREVASTIREEEPC